jgi:Cu+-exporting ATPase
MATDPVCGMQVDQQQARAQGLTSDYEGQTYYFCGKGCKRAFDQEPRRYAQQPAQR